MNFASVKAGYEAWAASYDTVNNLTRDLDAAVLRAQPFQLSGACVVELGCVIGKNTVWLAEHAQQVIAIDFSEPMLDRARQRVVSDRVRFIRQDILEPWPIPDGSTDLVTANLVLERIADLRSVFHQAHRVLKSGALLFVCELHPFRQMLGQQPQVVDPSTGNLALIPAFRHEVSDFVNDGTAEGLTVAHLGEWREPGAESGAVPRLLSVTFARV